MPSQKLLFLKQASELGKISQVMPQWVRAVCRSRIDFDEDEIAEYFRQQNIATLEKTHLRDQFAFIERHIGILSTVKPGEVRKIASKRMRLKYGETGFMTCRYQTEGKKFVCWSCPMVRHIIEEVMKTRGVSDGKETTHESGR